RLENGQPLSLYLFVPVAQAELLDTWRVRGMRGTGTHHFAVNDVFVPAERSVHPASAPLVEPGPLYRIPRTLLFAPADSPASLARFAELAGAQTPRARQAMLRDQAIVQSAVGPAEANLRSARAFLFEAVREIWSAATAGAVSLDHRAALRLAATHSIRLAAQI